MCTSLTYQDLAGQPYLARTMDFPTTTSWRPIFIPRHFAWPTGVATIRNTHYAFLGGGRLPVHFATPLMADGVNERGLACAELYLPHAVHYQATVQSGAINLSPQGFINWVLGEHASLAAVIADLPRVNLVAARWGGDDQVYPFHWLLSDRTGTSIVIEPTKTPLEAQPNSLGVLTNTPLLAEHLRRLRQLLDVPANATIEVLATAAQTWQRRHELPSGPIPTTRFIHMAIRKLATPTLPPSATPSALFRWLAEVQLPYDPAKRDQVSHNYTHYRAVIDLQHLTYAFQARTAHHVRTFQLTPAMAVNWQVPFVYHC